MPVIFRESNFLTGLWNRKWFHIVVVCKTAGEIKWPAAEFIIIFGQHKRLNFYYFRPILYGVSNSGCHIDDMHAISALYNTATGLTNFGWTQTYTFPHLHTIMAHHSIESFRFLSIYK